MFNEGDNMNREVTKKIGVWVLALSLLMAHIFFRSLAHADEAAPWKLFYPTQGTCAISFPTPPSFTHQSLKVSEEGHKLDYDIFLAPFEDKGIFMLLVATYPLPLSGGHEVAGLEGLLKGILAHHPDNQLIYAELVQFGGRPALNFLIQSTSNYFRGHALMVGNKLYLIAMEGGVSDLNENTFAYFLKSFKLLE